MYFFMFIFSVATEVFNDDNLHLSPAPLHKERGEVPPLWGGI
jgi:hypothetical protein